MSEAHFTSLKDQIQGTLFIGADRTGGMGELEINLVEKPAPTFDLDIWNNKFKEKLKHYLEKIDPQNLPLDQIDKSHYFSIKMESHAILVDFYLQPTTHLPLPFPDIEIQKQILKEQVVRGWQSAWGLPKPDDIAIQMGSVFLYRYTGNEPEKLTAFLKELSQTGIGLRKEEGFGKIQVCDPFHIHFAPQEPF